MLLNKKELKFMGENFSTKNSGYSIVSPAIDRCLFLSDMAKKVYGNISHYAYRDKRNAFPSQDLLAMELRTTRKRIGQYIAELESKGFLTINKRRNSNSYYLVEVDSIPLLTHSESVWKVFYEIEDFVSIKVFDKTVTLYQESELFRTIFESQTPSEYESEIRDYFCQTLGIYVKSRISHHGQANKDSLIEELTSYFYARYEAKYGNKVLPDPTCHNQNLKSMERVIKARCSNIDDVKTCIDIFIESDSIDSCTVSTFSKDSVQHRLTKAIKNCEQTICMHRKKQSPQNIDFKPVQEYDDFFSRKKRKLLG